MPLTAVVRRTHAYTSMLYAAVQKRVIQNRECDVDFYVFGLPTEKLCDINAKFLQEPAEVRSRTWPLWKVRVNAIMCIF